MTWAPDYCTAEELADFMRVADDADVIEMGFAIAAASRAIDRACNRQFGLDEAPTERFYTARYDRRRGRWVVPIDDLMTTTGLEIHFDSGGDLTFGGAIDSYRLLSLNAAAAGRPWTELVVMPDSATLPTGAEGAVKVSGRFGWTNTPFAVVEACLLQSSRFMARRDSPFGVAGSPDIGSEVRLLARVDPDVEVALASYRRLWTAA